MAIPSVNLLSNQPGGGALSAMGATNSLANSMLLRKINQVQAQYAPITTQAEAASKLAYANFIAPQFISKLMNNPDFMAQLSDTQANALKSLVTNSASGQNTGLNNLRQLEESSSIQQPSRNSFLDTLKNTFQKVINPQLNNTMQGIAHVESGGANNPYTAIGKDTGNGNRALGKYQVMESNIPSWTKEALGNSITPQEFLSSPDAQEKVAAYMMNKHLNAGHSPQDVGSIWFTGKPLAQAGNVQDVNGTSPGQYVTKMNEGMGQNWAENAGKAKGIIEEGGESGEIRSKNIEDLNNTVFNAETNATTLNEINDILASPEFQQIRNTPLAGQHELAYYAKEGTPAQQNMVGRYYTLTGNIIKDASRDFAGQFRKGEQSLLQGMKPSPSDTVDVARGKSGMLTVLNKILMERSRLTSKYMTENHINKLQASEMADKRVNGDKIRQEVQHRLHPNPTEEDIKHMMKLYNISHDEVINRLRKKGIM